MSLSQLSLLPLHGAWRLLHYEEDLISTGLTLLRSHEKHEKPGLLKSEDVKRDVSVEPLKATELNASCKKSRVPSNVCCSFLSLSFPGRSLISNDCHVFLFSLIEQVQLPCAVPEALQVERGHSVCTSSQGQRHSGLTKIACVQLTLFVWLRITRSDSL